MQFMAFHMNLYVSLGKPQKKVLGRAKKRTFFAASLTINWLVGNTEGINGLTRRLDLNARSLDNYTSGLPLSYTSLQCVRCPRKNMFGPGSSSTYILLIKLFRLQIKICHTDL